MIATEPLVGWHTIPTQVPPDCSLYSQQLPMPPSACPHLSMPGNNSRSYVTWYKVTWYQVIWFETSKVMWFESILILILRAVLLNRFLFQIFIYKEINIHFHFDNISRSSIYIPKPNFTAKTETQYTWVIIRAGPNKQKQSTHYFVDKYKSWYSIHLTSYSILISDISERIANFQTPVCQQYHILLRFPPLAVPQLDVTSSITMFGGTSPTLTTKPRSAKIGGRWPCDYTI